MWNQIFLIFFVCSARVLDTFRLQRSSWKPYPPSNGPEMNQEEEMGLSSGTFPELTFFKYKRKSIDQMSKHQRKCCTKKNHDFTDSHRWAYSCTDVIRCQCIKRWWFQDKGKWARINHPNTCLKKVFMQTSWKCFPFVAIFVVRKLKSHFLN